MLKITSFELFSNLGDISDYETKKDVWPIFHLDPVYMEWGTPV